MEKMVSFVNLPPIDVAPNFHGLHLAHLINYQLAVVLIMWRIR